MQFLNIATMLVIIFCIVTEAGRELCFKGAADSGTLIKNLKEPLIWFGVMFWAIEIIAWMDVLTKVPLSIAFPLMSLSYVVILIAGAFVFKERIHWQHALGALFITAGVACVGATGV